MVECDDGCASTMRLGMMTMMRREGWTMRALGFADFLHDDLLGSLCSNAAELDGLDLFFDDITDLGARMRLRNLARPGFDSRIIKIVLFDDRPATESLVGTGVAVDFHTQINFVFKTLVGRAPTALCAGDA